MQVHHFAMTVCNDLIKFVRVHRTNTVRRHAHRPVGATFTKRIKPIELDSADLVCDDWEEAVDRFGDRVAIVDDRRTVTYRELDAMANRFGHWAQSRRLKRGDTIALVMLNRAERQMRGA